MTENVNHLIIIIKFFHWTFKQEEEEQDEVETFGDQNGENGRKSIVFTETGIAYETIVQEFNTYNSI